MELSERKNKILAAVVEQYIKTGEPVGSKMLLSLLDISVSSATVRNEMSELAEMGLLEQPHTSSGRIPTHKGYRYYIDKLMSERTLGDEQRRRIDMMLGVHFNDPEKLLEQAGEILADITNCAVVSSLPVADDAVIKKVELVPVSRKTAIVVLLTSNGILKDRVCRSDTEITEETVQSFYNMAAKYFVNKHISDVNTLMIQSLAVSFGENSLIMLPFIIAVSDLIKDLSQADIMLEGQTNLFNNRELGSDVYALMELLGRRETVSRILSSAENKVNVFIGNENPFEQLTNSSMIVSRYTVNDSDSGAFGIIGSTRMDYARLVPSIKYLTKLVGEILDRTLLE